jgi:hypothetical protein
MGDLHIKMMLSDPKLYSVDKSIVEFVIQAIFESLWDKKDSKIHLNILQGEHLETAFVEIKTSIDCLKVNRAPLFAPYKSKNL